MNMPASLRQLLPTIPDYWLYCAWEAYVIGGATALWYLLFAFLQSDLHQVAVGVGVFVFLGEFGLFYKLDAEGGESIWTYFICYFAAPGIAALLFVSGFKSGLAVLLFVFVTYYRRPNAPNLPVPTGEEA